ncbi:MAG TPA: flagellar motor protein MotB [Stellaceae bacterium]|nr:flagellar motor protein MotB [Stellaceae bacterium]
MRKQLPKKHQNLERWIISYADFTTLLLATFVVMYAVSSINSAKFQEMAEAFSTAFMGKITRVQATGFAAANKAPFDFMPSPVHMPIITRDEQVKHLPPALTQAVAHRAEQLEKAYKKLQKLLGGMIRAGQVDVSLKSLGVVVNINSVLLFDSGKADLTAPALGLVDEVAGVLKDLHYPIQVNGFTDTQPIHNSQFSSNWDLSAARAIAVVKRLAGDGIPPSSLVGAGYGEYHPVAANDTPAGKAKNRRVSIVVVAPLDDRSIIATPLVDQPGATFGGGTAAPQMPPAAANSVAPAAAAPAAAPPPAAAPGGTAAPAPSTAASPEPAQ